MVRFTPYEKLPKKKQHELDQQKRGSWNGVNPVTRKPEDSKVYNRNKAQSWKKDNSDALLFFSLGAVSKMRVMHFRHLQRRY